MKRERWWKEYTSDGRNGGGKYWLAGEKLHTSLSGVNTENIKGRKKQQKKPQRVTEEQTFQAMIAKMKINVKKLLFYNNV